MTTYSIALDTILRFKLQPLANMAGSAGQFIALQVWEGTGGIQDDKYFKWQ